MKRVLVLFALGILVLAGTFVTGKAAENPIQLALVTPIQIVPEGEAVSAFRFNLIYGKNTSVVGLDLGLINHSTSGLSKGLQIGLVGLEEADFHGWQANWTNVTRGDFKGFQWGFVNYTKSARGLQLGFFNYTETMYGLQLGFINVIRKGGLLPVFPFVNFSF
jgi:hypothetical protein